MKSMYVKIATLTLIMGLLSACGAQPVETADLQPTREAVPATQAPTDAPPATDTVAPTESVPATEAPATDAAATEPAAQGATVSFAGDVLPIIQSRCVSCHGGDRIEEGLLMRSHAEIIAGSDNGPVISPGDAANSLLVELVATQKMPKRGPKLTPPQVQVITDWVNQGAPDN